MTTTLLAAAVILLSTALGWSMRRTRTAKAERDEAEQEARTAYAAVGLNEASIALMREQLAEVTDELAWSRMTIAAVAQHCGDAPIHEELVAEPSSLGKKRAAKAVRKS